MGNLCEGRVAVVTGAGRGIGREHALLLAENGARVVVNDLGGDAAGDGADLSPAQEVVAEIEAMGGEAVVNGANVVCGGDVDAGTLVNEEYLMALERQAFCALLQHPKTQERIMGMLSTGKPVRN